MPIEHALLAYLDTKAIHYRLLKHPPCRTSDECAVARAAAGAPATMGAKALIVFAARRYVMLVLPGTSRLDNQRARPLIGKFRFATPDEVRDATCGLEIGTIPPFGRPVFPKIERLIVDRQIVASAEIGFNAACLTRSAVMSGEAYRAAAEPDCIEHVALHDRPETI